MMEEITSKLAAEILHEKIRSCNEKIANSPEFLKDDLRMEEASYKRQLKKIRGDADGL